MKIEVATPRKSHPPVIEPIILATDKKRHDLRWQIRQNMAVHY